MRVIFKGSMQLQDGTEKVTLGIPEGAEDELHIIKKAVRRGETIGLVILTPDEPLPQEFATLIEIVRDYGLKQFEEGKKVAKLLEDGASK